MQKFLFLIWVLIEAQKLFAQAPDLIWQNTLNGNNSDQIQSITIADDGNYIVSGISNSLSSLDKSENFKGNTDYYDYWIVKLNKTGAMLWENTIGGKRDEWNSVVKSTSDGGCIVGGTSQSTANGDKDEPNIGGLGGMDIWVLKLDASGNILWQNTIGGSNSDWLRDMVPTPDGGFILLSQSNSNIGFDKSENGFGGYDFWVIKLNSLGEVNWNITIGGNLDENPTAITQTDDGNFVIGGYSLSGLSGNKTTLSNGNEDYWIVKISNGGSILWQKSFGTSKSDLLFDIANAGDGGLVLGGYTTGGVNGDKTSVNYGLNDYWVIKTNNVGSLVWQFSAGGSKEDWLTAVETNTNGEIFLGGSSISPISGNKIEGVNANSFDNWILKLNTTGNIIWQKDIQGNSSDYLGDMVVNDNNELIVGAYSFSTAGYDKLEPWYGVYDYWIYALGDTCNAEMCNAVDDDCDGVIDEDIIDTVLIVAEGNTAFCTGYAVDLHAYTNGEDIQWQKNGINIPGAVNAVLTVTKKGTYTCILYTACGIVTSNPITITTYKTPIANIIADGPTTFCPGDNVVLTCTNLPVSHYSYKWYRNGSIIPGEIDQNLTAEVAGTYTCLVSTVEGSCADFSNEIIVNVACKSGNTVIENVISPNPCNGEFYIHFTTAKDSRQLLLLYNAAGQLMYQEELNVDQHQHSMVQTNLLPGLYFLQLSANGLIYQNETLIITQ